VHTLLLKGQSLAQGLTIERPVRTTGTLVGAGVSLVALGLALALVLRASGWPVSFTQFLAYVGAGVLLLLALLFAFWAYGCYSLRYVVDRTGLTIVWGPLRHFVSLDRIQAFVHGRGEHRPKVSGVGWRGYHIGRGYVDEFGRVLFFSTHRAPEELVYVQTPDTTYALSPEDPARFVAKAQRFQQARLPDAQAGLAASAKPAVQRDLLAAHPIWADRVAQSLAVLAVLANLTLWGFLFAVYPDLNNQIQIEFPPIGDVTTLQSRAEIFKIAGTASAILLTNVVAALAFQWRERAASYLLLSGAILFQALFWVAAIIAVVNA
jgi:PH (Pleckstrin Homology) domain-containing protein